MEKDLKKLIISIDFDDTIAYTKNFAIGELKQDAKYVINKWYNEGHYIIINTCRTDKDEIDAQLFLDVEGIKYHKINENNPKIIEYFKNNTRKIYADVYINDKNIENLHKKFYQDYWFDYKTENWTKYLDMVEDILCNKDFKPLLTLIKENENLKWSYSNPDGSISGCV